MALKAYGCPRRINLGGSLSEEVVVDQSITAGCSLAKDLLQVLLYRAMVRVGAWSPASVIIRVFVDDFGLQWQGYEETDVTDLQGAMDKWTDEVEKLQLKNADDKEAVLVSDKKLLSRFRGFKKHKRKVFKQVHCYVGFDIFLAQ